MKATHCDNCGAPLPPNHRRWCKNPACVRQKEIIHKRQMRDSWKASGGTRRKPDNLKTVGHPDRKCQYPPDAIKKCGKSLSNTANYFFCEEHAHKVHLFTGIENE